MNLRTIRDTFAPFATWQTFLSLVNPVLRPASSRAAVQARLAELLRRHRIVHLDLGGWSPVEGYLTIHLSSVEPYGWPQVPATTLEVVPAADENAVARSGKRQIQPRNLDAPAVTLHFDILGGLPLADATLTGVNMSHMLEHFDLDTGRAILRECRRVLRPGGVTRVSCPDLRKYAAAYLADDAAFFKLTGSRAFCNYPPLPTPGAIVAAKAYDADNGHRWFYDAPTVVALMQETGYARAAECGLHESALPRIADVEPAYREPESFYVEGIA